MLTVLATRTALATLTTTRTAWALSVALWLLFEHAVRQLVLTRLRINLQELHLDMVTLVDTSLLNSLETLPCNLRDMEQALTARRISTKQPYGMMLLTTPS